MLRQCVAVVARLGACPANESSTVNPEHYRKLASDGRRPGRVDIQNQAILTLSSVGKNHVGIHTALHAVRPELGCLAQALPCDRCSRCLPAAFSDRWRGIGKAK